MHALASKSLSKERELTPRYYYKLSEKVSWVEKVKNLFRLFFTFLFTQVGVIVLITVYMISGAAIFHHIEHDSLMDIPARAAAARHNASSLIWAVTVEWNNFTITPEVWRRRAAGVILDFQESAVSRVRAGWTGREPGERVWTFSSSLMFSLAISTTIGYGNLVPRTAMGKVVTMLYSLLGIPIMFIYVATIGSILAKGCEEKPTDLPKKATLPSVQTDTMSIAEEEYSAAARGSITSFTKMSRNSSFRFDQPAAQPPDPGYQPKTPPTPDSCPAPPAAGGKEKRSVLRSLVTNLKQSRDADTEAADTGPDLERMTSKNSRRSGLSVAGASTVLEQDTVKFKLVEDLSLVTVPITTCLLVLLGYIMLGAALFSVWEGWTILDGAYFCFTSLMTIGFGDFVPGDSYIYNNSAAVSAVEGNAKMILGTVYLLLGLAIIAMVFNLMGEKLFTQIRFLGRMMGVIKNYSDDDI